jgi:acid phosphatase type 7
MKNKLSLILILTFLLYGCEKEHNPINIAIYGDSRGGYDIHRQIVKNIISYHIKAVFQVGDLVSNGNISSEWDTIHSIIAPIREKAKYYPTIGNHDLGSDSLFFKEFSDVISPNGYYKVQIENMYFFILNCFIDFTIDSEQMIWLENELKKVPHEKSLIAIIEHKPFFSSGVHGGLDSATISSICPLFEKYSVDVVFSGDDHDYERSVYNNITYVVTGGGGAPLYTKTKNNIYSKVYLSEYHYCIIHCFSDKWNIEVRNIENKVIDKFEL